MVEGGEGCLLTLAICRLLRLVAEDCALGDTLYALCRSFYGGRAQSSLALASFLKSIREVARDQFMIKALLYKINAQS